MLPTPFLLNSKIEASPPQYSVVTKYALPELSKIDTYSSPLAFEASDGTIWYSVPGGLKNYNPQTGLSSERYNFPGASPTRYRYLMGPDDNIYYMGGSSDIRVFDTHTRQGDMNALEIRPDGNDCYDYYNDFTFNGKDLVISVNCQVVLYDEDGDEYNEEVYGLALYDVFTKIWSFVAIDNIEYPPAPTGMASDGAGRVVIVDNQQIFVFETDCQTGKIFHARTIKLANDGYMFVDMTGSPSLALDQKGNLYIRYQYYDADLDDYPSGIGKLDVVTGDSQIIPDTDDYSAEMMVRAVDDNIYFTTEEAGIIQIDTLANTASVFYEDLMGLAAGYNPGAVSSVNGNSIWTTWVNPDDPDDRGVATFSITDGGYPNRDPYTCPVSKPDDSNSPNIQEDSQPIVVLGAPNTSLGK